jgi:hypothetical protein
MFGEAADKWIKLADDVIKLMQATRRLRQSMRTKQKEGVAKGVQDISFWISKIMTSLPAADDNESHLSMYKKAMAAIFEAQKIANEAKQTVGISITNPRAPKEEPSFGAATLGSMMNAIPLGGITPEEEWEWMQPLRFTSAVVGGPVLLYAARQIEQNWLSHVVSAIGVSITAINLWTWNSRRKALDKVLK